MPSETKLLKAVESQRLQIEIDQLKKKLKNNSEQRPLITYNVLQGSIHVAV